jgi:hypothetical protein
MLCERSRAGAERERGLLKIVGMSKNKIINPSAALWV